MSKEKFKIVNTHKISEKEFYEWLIQSLTGMSIKEFAQEIKNNNINLKASYNFLYSFQQYESY